MSVRNVLFAGIVLLIASNISAEETGGSGQILMSGDHILVVDLAMKKERHQKIANAPEEFWMRSISKIDGTKLLVGFTDRTGDDWVYILDVVSWKVTKLVHGRRPLALKGHNKFLFIAEREEDELSYLYMANMDENPISITRIYPIDIEALDHDYPLVQVSKDKVIASGPKGHSHEAYEIDLNTLEYKPSPIGKCIPSVWFESRGQLLCGKGEAEYEQVLMFFRKQTSETTYFLTSLDGKERKEWNVENLSMDRADFDRPLHYIPEADVLLIKRERSSIGYGGALYAYDMKSKKQHWLLNGMISPSSIVWISGIIPRKK